jgi:hypothetical protein
MSEPDFFDRTEMRLRAGMRRGAHLPWRTRLMRFRASRPLAVVLAALVVATPAVAAATNWFGIGAPNRIPKQSPTQDAGRAFASTSELLSLRVQDPQGGPPWGMRIVRTTRGATCVQIGRVEDRQLGSLGIDGAWKNDHLFHPFPKTAEGNGFECGTTDGAGHAFFDSEFMGLSASATTWATGNRLLYVGLLGPDATTITYEAPTGTLASTKANGSDGAYLFVFARNNKTCKLYADNPNRFVESPQCSGVSGGEAIGSPIRSVTYRDGQRCWPGLSPTVRRRLDRFVKHENAKLHIAKRSRLNSSQSIQFRRDENRFLATQHLSLATFRDESFDRCPAIGYVPPHEKHLTTAMVEAPIHIQVEAKSKWGIPVHISFTARQPVASSSSWYEGLLRGPCEGFSVGQIGFGNIHVGQTVHDNQILSPGQRPSCKGVYHGIISYMQNSGPIGAVGEGTQEMPGKDGSIIVARFSFTVH